MENLKQEVQDLISKLPEETTLEDIQYHLYVLQKIKRGLSEAESKKLISSDEMKDRLGKWLEK
jgi:hypothetical protein